MKIRLKFWRRSVGDRFYPFDLAGFAVHAVRNDHFLAGLDAVHAIGRQIGQHIFVAMKDFGHDFAMRQDGAKNRHPRANGSIDRTGDNPIAICRPGSFKRLREMREVQFSCGALAFQGAAFGTISTSRAAS